MDLPALRSEQRARAVQVEQVDRWETPAFIAGADVGFEQDGLVTRAALAVLRYPELTLVEYQVARIETQMPYIPGFLSFREYPALLQAWGLLQHRPQLVMVDGHGSPIRAALGSPAILVCWPMYPPSELLNGVCADSRRCWMRRRGRRWRSWMGPSSLVGCCVARLAVIRCSSPVVIA